MLSEDELYTKCLNSVLNFISYNSRTHREVEQKITGYFLKLSKRYSLDQEALNRIKTNIVAYVMELGFLDDEAYAKQYIAQKLEAQKGLSRRELSNFLYKKGISPDIIETSLVSYTNSIEKSILQKIVDIRLRQANVTDKQALRMRTISYLLRRGFTPELVYHVVDTKTKLN